MNLQCAAFLTADTDWLYSINHVNDNGYNVSELCVTKYDVGCVSSS